MFALSASTAHAPAFASYPSHPRARARARRVASSRVGASASDRLSERRHTDHEVAATDRFTLVCANSTETDASGDGRSRARRRESPSRDARRDATRRRRDGGAVTRDVARPSIDGERSDRWTIHAMGSGRRWMGRRRRVSAREATRGGARENAGREATREGTRADAGTRDGGDGSGSTRRWGRRRRRGGRGTRAGGTRSNARREDDGNGTDDDGGRDARARRRGMWVGRKRCAREGGARSRICRGIAWRTRARSRTRRRWRRSG